MYTYHVKKFPFLEKNRSVVAIWLAWAVALSLFQGFVAARFSSRPVDRALAWTVAETGRDTRAVKARLSVPYLSERVAWDSEFYLSIAIAGYDDPVVRKVVIPGTGAFSLDYAFMPGYPAAIRVAMAPLLVIGVESAGAAAIAGVAVSSLASLFAAIALARLARGSWRHSRRAMDARGVRALAREEGTRAAWLMLVFPSGFFLAQVYTEALFLAFALWAIAFARDRRWFGTALLASCAVLTRAAGVALVPAIAIVAGGHIAQASRKTTELRAGVAPGIAPDVDAKIARNGGGLDGRERTMELLGIAEAILVPLSVFIVWKLSVLGTRFDIVERAFFGRAIDPVASIRSWLSAFASIGAGKGDAAAYYALELASLVAALASAAWGFRRHPDLAVFGLATLALSFFSCVPQGLVRYALSCPLVFVLAARLTRNRGAERAYATASVLLMGFLAALFTLDMWVG